MHKKGYAIKIIIDLSEELKSYIFQYTSYATMIESDLPTIFLKEQELSLVSKAILNSIQSPYLLFLSGTLGSGKTTFAKNFLSHLGVKDTINSPTFYNHQYLRKQLKTFSTLRFLSLTLRRRSHGIRP